MSRWGTLVNFGLQRVCFEFKGVSTEQTAQFVPVFHLFWFLLLNEGFQNNYPWILLGFQKRGSWSTGNTERWLDWNQLDRTALWKHGFRCGAESVLIFEILT